MQNDSLDTNTTSQQTPASSAHTYSHVSLEYVRTILLTLLAAGILKLFVVEAFRIPSPSMEDTLLVGDFILVNKFAYGLRTPRTVPFTDARIPSLVIPLWSHVRRGDVVVFDFPGMRDEVQPEESVNYIKRCIGLPGDQVEIRKGKVRVNGNALTFPRFGRHPSDFENTLRLTMQLFPTGSTYTDIDYGPIRVPRRGDVIPLGTGNFEQWRVFIGREGHHAVLLPSGDVQIDGQQVTGYRVERDYYFMMGDNRDNSLDSRYWGFVPDENIVGEALMVYWSWDSEVSVTSISEKFATIRWNRVGAIVR